MTLEASIRQHLTNWPEIAALAAARVYWLRQPQAGQTPAVSFLLASQNFEGGFGKFAVRTGVRSLYQFDCWAPGDRVDQARDLARAVIAAMRMFPGCTDIRAQMDHYRPEPTDLARAIVEAEILHTQE